MKALVLSQYWAPENGVPQRRWAWLTSVLTSHDHQVTVIAPPPQNQQRSGLEFWKQLGLLWGTASDEAGLSGERVLRAGYFPSRNSVTSKILNQASVAFSTLVVWRRHRELFGREKPDVVIGTVPALPTAFVTYFIARLTGVPYVIDLRDAWPDLLHNSRHWNSGTGQRSWREKIFSKGPLQVLIRVTEWSLNGVLEQASGIMTTSEELEAHLEQRFRTAAHPRSRAHATVRNVFPPHLRPRRMYEHDRDKRLHVLYAGTVGRAQRLDNAVMAAQIAWEKGYDVSLKIVGEGASWKAVYAQAEEANADVEVLHSVSAARLHEFYEWADTALVHLADWEPLRRTVPSKTYELMSNGIHISAVVDGETARMIESLDAGGVATPGVPAALANLWISLIEDPQLLEVGETGEKWVRREREEVAPRRLLSLLNSIVMKNNSPTSKEKPVEDQ